NSFYYACRRIYYFSVVSARGSGAAASSIKLPLRESPKTRLPRALGASAERPTGAPDVVAYRLTAFPRCRKCQERLGTRMIARFLKFLAAAVTACGLSFSGAVAQENGVLPQEGRIAGVVVGDSGPEAGVWVIAETNDLPTKYAKIAVTDDEGR